MLRDLLHGYAADPALYGVYTDPERIQYIRALLCMVLYIAILCYTRIYPYMELKRLSKGRSIAYCCQYTFYGDMALNGKFNGFTAI